MEKERWKKVEKRRENIFNGTVVSTAFWYSMYVQNLFSMLLFFMFVRSVLDGANG
jgi:hypothetical protein